MHTTSHDLLSTGNAIIPVHPEHSTNNGYVLPQRFVAGGSQDMIIAQAGGPGVQCISTGNGGWTMGQTRPGGTQYMTFKDDGVVMAQYGPGGQQIINGNDPRLLGPQQNTGPTEIRVSECRDPGALSRLEERLDVQICGTTAFYQR